MPSLPWTWEDDWGGIGNCSSVALDKISQLLKPQMVMRANMLIIISIIFVGILVAIGLFMPHYRHRSSIRFFFLLATTSFLPILSYIVSNGVMSTSTFSSPHTSIISRVSVNTEKVFSIDVLLLFCNPDFHFNAILLWVGLAQLIGISTSTIVVADERESRNNGPSLELVSQAMWTSYLVACIIKHDALSILHILFALVIVKMFLQCLAFWHARGSLAYKRNPRLIVGYMMQLRERRQQTQDESHHVGLTVEQHEGSTDGIMLVHEERQEGCHHVRASFEKILVAPHEKLIPPPLIVMGEERQDVDEKPQGYYIKLQLVNNSLVTIDKVWKMDYTTRIKDLCFSFALFKLLRCRFAGYSMIEAGFTQVHNFFWHELLLNISPERVFRVIEDELSFMDDYYYTSLPLSYTKSWLPRSSMCTSFLAILHCLYVGWIMGDFVKDGYQRGTSSQIYCGISCFDISRLVKMDFNDEPTWDEVNIGSLLFDIMPIFLLLALVVCIELRLIGSYIFSSWTNVALIYGHIAKHDTIWRPPFTHRWFSTVSELIRCMFMKHRMDQVNQCSVLVLHPREHRTVRHARLLIRLGLADRSKKVNVPPEVKVVIIDTLVSNNGVKSSGDAFLPQKVRDGSNFLWDYIDKGTAYTILTCHIATSLLELRSPRPSTSSVNEITATHLSRYCAYLVSHAPELLPDDDRWCESLYKAVKENSLDVLASGAEEFHVLVASLHGQGVHEVLQEGAYVATRLVTEHGGKEWNVLAKFWSEMILHVASLSKLDHHTAAMAGGVEFITVLWALIMHAGPCPEAIASRSRATSASGVGPQAESSLSHNQLNILKNKGRSSKNS